MNELHFTKKDFKIDWFSGSGAGGQHRNKHQNCCRITHIASSLRALGTESRNRTVNQRTAFKRLVSLLLLYYMPLEEKDRVASSEIIRNYNECRNEIHDKKSGFKQSYKEVIGKGDLGLMIEARRKAMITI